MGLTIALSVTVLADESFKERHRTCNLKEYLDVALVEVSSMKVIPSFSLRDSCAIDLTPDR
jgi:hypothetical protein